MDGGTSITKKKTKINLNFYQAMEANEYFFLNVTGQIDFVHYPIGFECTKLFCRYDIVAGNDWQLVSGMSSGVTQNASVGQSNDKIVFNMPLEMTFKSTNPFGWPQIVFSLYGTNWWRTETSQGYARIHVPLRGSRTTIEAPILTAKCTNLWSSLSSWFTDRNPELRDPKILLEGTKSRALNMQSYGNIFVTLQTITRGGNALCLEWQ